ncbi:hypothetical protein K493DRAFT_317485 [Basidiobolus meristosporus CBS 931.73]|uniref:Uncharacterized protein n=1 Tax=Basidiobolus meristosporus CBS 931.73 TaxID=1314790 RepID=A0A1Y1Y0H3_9FUNG|nr:hypothetical protein K493DRAFT_317485 [Basidiobolus meristosporus CBS 931.73]|eukprot:ORX91124.1 hypothetical protein K493DRAFT_317485 [Basidiobolus meristosporus CBS 931.73]
MVISISSKLVGSPLAEQGMWWAQLITHGGEYSLMAFVMDCLTRVRHETAWRDECVRNNRSFR